MSAAVKRLNTLRAIHAMRDAGKPPPTVDEIARHMKASADDVLTACVEMKAKGIITDRKRGDRREWQRRAR